MRITDEVNNDASNSRNRILLVKHYGYRNYNYLLYAFADSSSANHHYNTPSSYFTYYDWYYTVVTVDYTTGKYSAYLYEKTMKLKWSYTRSVTANRGVGL